MKKRLLGLLIFMMMLLGSISVKAEPVWSVNEQGVLTISGTGRLTSKPKSNWAQVTACIIEDGITEIGEYAFQDCSKMASITIPESVTDIGYNAFEGCFDLAEVSLAHGLKKIGSYAFADCSKLTKIAIPDSVITIGEGAFFFCSSLSDLTLSDNVQSIGEDAFIGCSKTFKLLGYAGSYVHRYAVKHKISFVNICKHRWAAWKTVKTATALREGTASRSCRNCTESEVKSLPKLKATLSLSASKKTLRVKKTYVLKLTNLAAGDRVKSVISFNKSIASVKKIRTRQYRITARRKGTTTIQVVLSSGKKAVCRITVR